MADPFISVIIDTFNYGQFIEEAITSVLEQTQHEGVEIIVVDDGSTDDTPQRMRRFEGKLVYIRKKNGGQASALSEGFSRSKGGVIAFLDSDDLWAPDKLKALIKQFTDDPDLDIFYHNQMMVDRAGTRQRPLFSEEECATFHEKTAPGTPQGTVIPNVPGTSAMAFRRSCLARIMPVPDHYSICADMYLHYFACLFARRIYFEDRPLSCYRIHGTNRHSSCDPADGCRQLHSIFTCLFDDLLVFYKNTRCDISLLALFFLGAIAYNEKKMDTLCPAAWPARTCRRILLLKRQAALRVSRDGWVNFISSVILNRFDRVISCISCWLRGNNRTEDLILGTATGYSIDEVRPFIQSLKCSGYRGRIVLFVDDFRSTAAKFLQKQGVETLLFLPDQSPVTNRRYILYRDFLGKQKWLQRVIITDVRDVFFQGDPFRTCHGDSLYCFEEDPAIGLSACSFNRNWIKQMYGGDALEVLRHRPIICSGVVIGENTAMIRYLDSICRELAGKPAVWGGDQAALNMLVYSGRLPGAVVMPNEAGPVYTLGHVRPEKIRFSPEGFLISPAGIPAVIHQYDRHPVLAGWVKKKFSPD
ncbi:MAG: glycosyltransferase [Methanoregula sp.]|jgi:hypothetical protein